MTKGFRRITWFNNIFHSSLNENYFYSHCFIIYWLLFASSLSFSDTRKQNSTTTIFCTICFCVCKYIWGGCCSLQSCWFDLLPSLSTCRTFLEQNTEAQIPPDEDVRCEEKKKKSSFFLKHLWNECNTLWITCSLVVMTTCSISSLI